MDQIVINGPCVLKGEIDISGSKNAALAVLAASVLFSKKVTLMNLPHIMDIVSMTGLLNHLGAVITIKDPVGNDKKFQNCLEINCSNIDHVDVPYEITKTIRASSFVLGPLLTKYKKAILSLPGGCVIGTRPINLHIEALIKLGAEIELQNGYIQASIKNDRLKGAVIDFPLVSVGATLNTICAAVLADGKTVINNAAKEPEIAALCQMLKLGGAQISGEGTSTITIIGVDKLEEVTFMIPPDRIEAITYAIAAVATKGDVILKNVNLDIFDGVKREFDIIGIGAEQVLDGIKVTYSQQLKPLEVETNAYPHFATDLQAQLTALLSTVKGQSKIKENIFEGRFMHIAEMGRMGADIIVHGNEAIINGVERLMGAEVMATDLRASGSLVISGLVAHGTTIINRVYHLDRGYENMVNKLRLCGADIHRRANKAAVC